MYKRQPFAGGATVFFTKPKVEINWLNDLDSELMICYEMMKNPETRERMAFELSKEIASKERWKEIFESQPQNDYEIGKKYYYLLHLVENLFLLLGDINLREVYLQKGGMKEYFLVVITWKM